MLGIAHRSDEQPINKKMRINYYVEASVYLGGSQFDVGVASGT
jgi:hypothetical protein